MRRKQKSTRTIGTMDLSSKKNFSQTWPRHLAMTVISLDTREEMITALELIDPQWRDWVKDYLIDWIRKAGGITKLKYNIEQDELKRTGKN